MCMFRQPKMPTPARQAIAAPDNAEATRRATMEARIRRMRSGAAANVLTSPVGIPAGSATMGGGQ
ncbi:hypothetical protein [Roseicyclus amphidinii]|uniref:hypothetical protein n=1 Tax=Roseicyclus amphidinii TaxID=3034232 RepID=UPI0024E1789A|nr:hypothetical protein [Roseicyclus sp. Amp-Y-6]